MFRLDTAPDRFPEWCVLCKGAQKELRESGTAADFVPLFFGEILRFLFSSCAIVRANAHEWVNVWRALRPLVDPGHAIAIVADEPGRFPKLPIFSYPERK